MTKCSQPSQVSEPLALLNSGFLNQNLLQVKLKNVPEDSSLLGAKKQSKESAIGKIFEMMTKVLKIGNIHMKSEVTESSIRPQIRSVEN